MSENELKVGHYYRYETEYFKVLALVHPTHGAEHYHILCSRSTQTYVGYNSLAHKACKEVSILEGMIHVGE